MNKKILITGMFILSSLLTIGAEINGEIKEKTRNKYIIRETNVLADGEKREKTNYGEKVKYYRDGRLVKIVGISGVSGDVISKITYDEYGYKDGKVLEEGELKRYRHGFLDGKSEDIEKGLVKEYNMGVYDGRVDESVDYYMGIFNGQAKHQSVEYKGYLYSNGILLVEGSKKIKSNDRKKYLKNIIVKEDGNTVLPSEFTGAYYVDSGYGRREGGKVTFYSRGEKISEVGFLGDGTIVYEYVYGENSKKVSLNYYEDGKLRSREEYGSNGLVVSTIDNDSYNGKYYTVKKMYQDGIPVGDASIIEMKKIGDGKTKVNILKGYYRAGIYTGSVPFVSDYDMEDGLNVAEAKTVVVPAGIDNPITIKERKDVEDISTYTGYIQTKGKERHHSFYYSVSKTLIRYENGVKKEEINYVGSNNRYNARSRKVYLPSGEIVKYIFGTDNDMYIKKSTEGNLVEISMTDNFSSQYGRKWVGKMKDGKFIGRWECYTDFGNKLEEAYDFGVDGSSYKGVFYFDDGSVKSTFKGKRNKGGLLIDTGQQVTKDREGNIEEVFIYGDSLSWNKDVTYKRYQDGKAVEIKTIKAAYGVEGSQFNYLNEVEEKFRWMVKDF